MGTADTGGSQPGHVGTGGTGGAAGGKELLVVWVAGGAVLRPPGAGPAGGVTGQAGPCSSEQSGLAELAQGGRTQPVTALSPARAAG